MMGAAAPIIFTDITTETEISNKGGDNMKFPGDNRTTSEIMKDINVTLQRCGIDNRLIIVKK
jgi:hypothetical protein